MIDSDSAAGLLSRLVRIPSINPRGAAQAAEAEMAQAVAAWMSEQGIAAQVEEVLPGRPNAVATLPGKDPNRILLLESHMDTVEVDNMTVPPFGAEVRGSRLYGRGACDAKGPLAAFMLAMADLKQRGITPPLTVMLGAVMDEEHQYKGVSHLMANHGAANPGAATQGAATQAADNHGPHFAAAIVGEPTELDLIVAHKGSVRFGVTTVGKAAHSSMPWQGDNAIERMADVIAFIRDILVPEASAMEHPRVGPATLCPSLIRGGAAINTVPETCRVDIDRRTLPGEDPIEVWQGYKARFESLMPGHIQVSDPFIVDYALDTEAESPIVTALQKQVRRVAGRDPRVQGVNYGTDGSKIARDGVPTVVFGPGSILQAHSAAEFIELPEIVQAAAVMARLLEGFNG